MSSLPQAALKPVVRPGSLLRIGDGAEPQLSADGRYVAYTVGGLNDPAAIWVCDRLTGDRSPVVVTRSPQSVASVRISADGRYIAFAAFDDGLVPGDTNGLEDAFLHDRVTGVTERVSVTSSRGQSTSALGSDGVKDVALSDDGRFVAFTTMADDIVPGDTNSNSDVFVHDRVKKTTTRESVGSDGAQIGWASRGVSMSGDGRVVAFVTDGTPFTDPMKDHQQWVFVVRDRQRAVTTVTPVTWVNSAALAADGRSAVMYVSSSSVPSGDQPGVVYGVEQVLVYDVTKNSAVRLAAATHGREGEFSTAPPAISADGRYVAFWSSVAGVVPQDQTGGRNAFVYDRTTGEIRRLDSSSIDVEQQLGGVTESYLTVIDISANGRIVAFDNPPGQPIVFINGS